MTYPHPDQEHSGETFEHYQEGSHDHSNQFERSIECFRFDENLPDDQDDMFTVRVFCSDKALAEHLQRLIRGAINSDSQIHERCNGIVAQRIASGPKEEEHAGRQVNGKNVDAEEYNGPV